MYVFCTLRQQEDERGFGFGLLESEVAGEMRLVVTEVTPGGPADRVNMHHTHTYTHVLYCSRHSGSEGRLVLFQYFILFVLVKLQEGTLHTGDYIISLDRHNALRMKQDKV